MSSAIQTKPMTWREYAALPDDGKGYQVIEGELIVTPAPTSGHQDVVLELAVPLRSFVKEHDLGKVFVSPIDVILSGTNIVQPDIIFIRKDRREIIADQIQGPPDLAVEVVSPPSGKRDTVDKLALYAKFAIRHYWIVSPTSRCVIVYRLAGDVYERIGLYQGEDRFESELFPGLTIDLTTLWPTDE